MPTLFAKFSLEVSSPCLLALTDGQVPQVVANIGDFRIAAKLLSTEDWHTKEKHDVNWTTRLRALEIEVSRDEGDSPPDVIVTPEGRQRKAGSDGPRSLPQLEAS